MSLPKQPYMSGDTHLFDFTIPEHVDKRHKEKVHLFDEVYLASQDITSTLYKKNKASFNLNTSSHPFVHSGYYDSKKDDVLYVKTEDGASVPKKDTVLTCEGTFVKATKISLPSHASLKRLLAGASSEDEKAYEQSWVRNKESKIYYHPKVENIVFVLSTFEISRMFMRVCESRGLMNLPQEVLENPMTTMSHLVTPFIQGFWAEYPEGTVHSPLWDYGSILYEIPHTNGDTYVKIPDNAPFLKGFYLKNGYIINFARELESSLNREGLENRPVFLINDPQGDSGYRVNNLGRPVNSATEAQCMRFVEDLGVAGINFPIPLGYRNRNIQVDSGSSRATSRPTQNNEGVMLNYTAKVDVFKACFMKTEREEEIHKQNQKDLEKYVKQHKLLREKYTLMKRTATNDGDYISADRKLRELGTKPRLPAHKQPIYLGVELELLPRKQVRNSQGRRDIIRDIANSKFGDHCIIKSDNSTGAYSFEVVTIPATLAYHKQMFEENFFNPQNAFDKRVMSTTACGIHVHISKNVFTKLSLGKFSSFINSPDNAEFIDAMANRKPTQYCRKNRLKGRNNKGFDVSATIAHRVNMEGASIGQFDDNRRVAVNTESNAHTVEVRIFKGSNTKNNIFRKMEFCESLVYFCRSHSLQQMTVYDYVNFILQKENRHTYPHVIKWLAHKNYVEHTSAKILGKKRLVHTYSTNLVPKPETVYHKNTK